jgi:phage/plasmid-like protein (TIGR03299 family)
METNQLFEKTFKILDETGTNFNVSKEQFYFPNGHIADGYYGIMRSDNNKCLGSVGKRYTVYQNSQLVEHLIQATELLNLDVTNGGILKNGAYVFYQMELPTEFIGKSNIKRQITALNTHDGSKSIGFGSSNTVVVCQNTFHKAYRDMTKAKHTFNVNEKVNELANGIKNTIEQDLLLMDSFKRMADVELKDEMIERVINKIFNVNKNDHQSEISTNKKNKIVSFANALETEINLEGKTIWGLFNAVTRYTNHVDGPKRKDDLNEYLMNGQGYQISNLCYDELMKFIEKNTSSFQFSI